MLCVDTVVKSNASWTRSAVFNIGGCRKARFPRSDLNCLPADKNKLITMLSCTTSLVFNRTTAGNSIATKPEALDLSLPQKPSNKNRAPYRCRTWIKDAGLERELSVVRPSAALHQASLRTISGEDQTSQLAMVLRSIAARLQALSFACKLRCKNECGV